MNSGYYAACAGLRTQTQALELIANNLANLNTTAFRAQQPTFRSLLAGSWIANANPINRATNDFNLLGGSRLDLTAGNLQATGNPLDLALEGDGFFVVRTPAGVRYTRSGNFQISTTGQLDTAQGDAVLGEQGPVIVPAGDVSISADGTISVNGAVAGKLRVVDFPPGTGLRSEGASYYSAPDGLARPAARAYVRQGMLESSNVSAVGAMVDLISVQRHADMMQRALSAYYNEFNRVASSDLPRV
ncbi:MAG TPA: flagellar basal-body rod protein FlgF [Terriglobales bacterium]|jgi:flagellar basal-body rod protein FlgF/flagellar basal-body rod protein FlgG